MLALLWSDDAIKKVTGKPPKFPQEERLYLLESIRYIHKVIVVNDAKPGCPSGCRNSNRRFGPSMSKMIMLPKKAFCKANNIKYQVLKNDTLNRFPDYVPDLQKTVSSRKKVIVTGCYDWFHSGHVRFFEEVSEIGDLYVCRRQRQNNQVIKRRGPSDVFTGSSDGSLFSRFDTSSRRLFPPAAGWLDAEPEMNRIKPDIYAVNEDGDRPEKREFCKANGIEYVILKRLPKPGLPRRQSTTLRGF